MNSNNPYSQLTQPHRFYAYNWWYRSIGMTPLYKQRNLRQMWENLFEAEFRCEPKRPPRYWAAGLNPTDLLVGPQ